jgi:hypothetical protein
VDRWTGGQVDRWTGGQADRWTWRSSACCLLPKFAKEKKKRLWLLVRKRTISIQRPATGRGILVQTFADRGVSRGQPDGSLTVVNLFSRPEPLLFIQVAPHLCSRGLTGPRFRSTAIQKFW